MNGRIRVVRRLLALVIVQRIGEGGEGGGRFSFTAYLSHFTINPASRSGRSTAKGLRGRGGRSCVLPDLAF